MRVSITTFNKQRSCNITVTAGSPTNLERAKWFLQSLDRDLQYSCSGDSYIFNHSMRKISGETQFCISLTGSTDTIKRVVLVSDILEGEANRLSFVECLGARTTANNVMPPLSYISTDSESYSSRSSLALESYPNSCASSRAVSPSLTPMAKFKQITDSTAPTETPLYTPICRSPMSIDDDRLCIDVTYIFNESGGLDTIVFWLSKVFSRLSDSILEDFVANLRSVWNLDISLQKGDTNQPTSIKFSTAKSKFKLENAAQFSTLSILNPEYEKQYEVAKQRAIIETHLSDALEHALKSQRRLQQEERTRAAMRKPMRLVRC